MLLAKRVFIVAGVYGILVLTPFYFLEKKIGEDYPPINHPEYYYGFLGVALAFQVLFLIVARDPARYRPVMIPCVLEKVSFGVAAIVLYVRQLIPLPVFAGGMVDLVFAGLFIAAYLRCRDQAT